MCSHSSKSAQFKRITKQQGSQTNFLPLLVVCPFKRITKQQGSQTPLVDAFVANLFKRITKQQGSQTRSTNFPVSWTFKRITKQQGSQTGCCFVHSPLWFKRITKQQGSQTSNARIKARIGIRLFCLCYDFTTKICGSKCFFVFFAVLIFTTWSILPPVMIYACMQQIKTHIVPTYFRQISTAATQLLRRNFPSTRTSRR